MPDKQYLALYDCRSKQEYIYRTNRIKEITGGSALLADIFSDFFNSDNIELKINANWKKSAVQKDYPKYFSESGFDAEVIYEGGGNVCVIYRDKKTFLKANKILSKQILEKTFTVGIIASGTEVTGNFIEDRKKLYLENTFKKNLGTNNMPCNVLPFTLTDRLTYQPIVRKERIDSKKEIMYTAESLKKAEKFKEIESRALNAPIFEDHLDSMTDKGTDSLLAVIYIDGNNMGSKIKNNTKNCKDYSSGINALRKFSVQTNHDFVERPLEEITQKLQGLYDFEADEKKKTRYLFRKVIGGGDEITLICNAHAVPTILDTYFKTLISSGSGNSSCAGVAIFHSHAPYSDVYEIAEQCCESGKILSHQNPDVQGNYIDFHYCHTGITNSLDKIREIQEQNYTARPYEFSSSWQEYIRLGNEMTNLNRSDIKSLGEAIFKGDSYFMEEIYRIRSRNKKLFSTYETDDDIKKIKKMIFDIAVVYDLWFDSNAEEEK